MFSHIMVGSNDLPRAKAFYDALFEKEGRTDDKGRSSWGRKGSVFMLTSPIDGQAATHANGGTIGFNFDTPEEVDAWHARGL
ncbi:MAG TPA: VOC family protein, partial [Sphingomicrobium sp.]|nr:VOC family protein [Sphingomicrobium sp.]